LHTHLLLHPYSETSWDDQVLKESLELRTIRGVVQARATLWAGFTAVRDLGTEGAGFADVALRDAIASRIIEGPRVFAVTRAIVAAVHEAQTAGVSVAAHATTTEGIERAIQGGVRTIEHGTGATAEQLARMKEKGMILCPTLAASEAIARYSGWRPGRDLPKR